MWLLMMSVRVIEALRGKGTVHTRFHRGYEIFPDDLAQHLMRDVCSSTRFIKPWVTKTFLPRKVLIPFFLSQSLSLYQPLVYCVLPGD